MTTWIWESPVAIEHMAYDYDRHTYRCLRQRQAQKHFSFKTPSPPLNNPTLGKNRFEKTPPGKSRGRLVPMSLLSVGDHPHEEALEGGTRLGRDELQMPTLPLLNSYSTAMPTPPPPHPRHPHCHPARRAQMVMARTSSLSSSARFRWTHSTSSSRSSQLLSSVRIGRGGGAPSGLCTPLLLHRLPVLACSVPLQRVTGFSILSLLPPLSPHQAFP